MTISIRPVRNTDAWISGYRYHGSFPALPAISGAMTDAMLNKGKCMTSHATIKSAGRDLCITGTVPLYLEWFNGWDADISAIYASSREIPSGSTVIDVGANIGIMSCSLAAQRPDINIIAIEPVADNFDCLKRNVADNGLTNVEVIHAAVSDKPGKVRVNTNGPWSAILENGESEVDAITLDQFNDRNITYVKIDVEGWEPYVLAGGRELFAKNRPLVLMEWNSWSLMAAHHDPFSFANAVWKAFSVTEMYFEEKPQGAPKSGIDIVHENITKHGSVTDILMRPRAGESVPHLHEMIYSPEHLKLFTADR
jgi:FkbM family methyltransferase